MTDVVDDKKTITVEEFEALQAKLTASIATNERILNEHKADKTKYRSKLGEYEEKDRLAAEASNDHKSLYEQSQVTISGLEKDLADTRYTSFEKNLTLEVSSLCKDAHNPLQVMRALSVNKDNTDLSNGTLTDLSVQIDGLRKNEPNLFLAEQKTQTTTIPRYMQSTPGEEKPQSEMTTAELEQQLKTHTAGVKP